MIKKSLKIFLSGLVAGVLCFAQNASQEQSAEADAYRISRRQNGQIISVGNREIQNIYLVNGGMPKENLHRNFMHGVVDGDATPVAWESLGSNLPLEAKGFNTPAKVSGLSSIVLKAGEKLTLPKPVISGDNLLPLNGQNVRIFIWMTGKNTGKGTDLWSGAPTIKVEVVDFDGELLCTRYPYFRTRGSFPWFCYYMDVEIPKLNKAPSSETSEPEADNGTGEGEKAKKQVRAGGLYLTLENPASGTAKFSTLSWKTIKATELLVNSVEFANRIDPKTNSSAPNPDYDELPMHLMFGLNGTGKWTFLEGNKAWGGILTSAKLSAYMDAAASDWMHCIHAVSKLVSIYNYGTQKQMCAFDENWKNTLMEKLPSMQDPATGMWKIGGVPSLYFTYEVVTNSYSPTGIRHQGAKVQETPWLSLEGMKLNNVDAMINSIIAQQKRYGEEKIAAGWNSYAFMKDVSEIREANVPCEIAPTAYAANLLAIASNLTQNDKLKKDAEQSIMDAWKFVMGNMFMYSSSLWKNSYSDLLHSVPGEMYNFLEATQWLDLRQNKALRIQAPTTTLNPAGEFTMKWLKPDNNFVSLRIFVAPVETMTSELTDANLIAIVQHESDSLLTRDPYSAIKVITEDAEKEWKITPASIGASYIAGKLTSMPKILRAPNNPWAVKIKIPKKDYVQAVHIAAVTAYGEMSSFITLGETIPAQESTETME